MTTPILYAFQESVANLCLEKTGSVNSDWVGNLTRSEQVKYLGCYLGRSKISINSTYSIVTNESGDYISPLDGLVINGSQFSPLSEIVLGQDINSTQAEIETFVSMEDLIGNVSELAADLAFYNDLNVLESKLLRAADTELCDEYEVTPTEYRTAVIAAINEVDPCEDQECC